MKNIKIILQILNTFSLQGQHFFQQVHQIVCQLGAFHHHLILLQQQFFVPLN
jgi:hypothetical protein